MKGSEPPLFLIVFMRNLALALTVLVCFAGCDLHDPTISFVFPDGFEGLARIKEDKSSKNELLSHDSTYVIEFPREGEITVKDISVFSRWHKYTAIFKNGKNIPWEDQGAALQLYTITVPTDSGICIFVGSYEDYRAVSRIFGGPLALPLGKKLSAKELSGE
jgi:hypothetical protein